jgi:hypothetical protein
MLIYTLVSNIVFNSGIKTKSPFAMKTKKTILIKHLTCFIFYIIYILATPSNVRNILLCLIYFSGNLSKLSLSLSQMPYYHLPIMKLSLQLTGIEATISLLNLIVLLIQIFTEKVFRHSLTTFLLVLTPVVIRAMGELFERKIRRILFQKKLTYWDRLHFVIILKRIVKRSLVPRQDLESYEEDLLIKGLERIQKVSAETAERVNFKDRE